MHLALWVSVSLDTATGPGPPPPHEATPRTKADRRLNSSPGAFPSLQPHQGLHEPGAGVWSWWVSLPATYTKTLHMWGPAKGPRQICFLSTQPIKPQQLRCCRFRGRETHARASGAGVRAAATSRWDLAPNSQALCLLGCSGTQTSEDDENELYLRARWSSHQP